MTYKLFSLTYKVLHGDFCSLIPCPSLTRTHSSAFLLLVNSSDFLYYPVWTFILEIPLPGIIFSQTVFKSSFLSTLRSFLKCQPLNEASSDHSFRKKQSKKLSFTPLSLFFHSHSALVFVLALTKKKKKKFLCWFFNFLLLPFKVSSMRAATSMVGSTLYFWCYHCHIIGFN